MHLGTFEEMLKSLFGYITNPTAIAFEDEIVLCLKTFINKNKQISNVAWECFKHFPLILQKNKGTFGIMHETINCYLINGKEAFNTTNK